MYFRSRDALNHGQLKGVDQDTATELCTIEFDDSKPLITLMPKREYREKYGKSPDRADSGIMLLEVARRKGFRLAPIGQTVIRHDDWERMVDRTQAVFETADYGVEELEIA
jgi:hypothetical protein